MKTIEQKRATYDKVVKVGLVALGALIISPIIFMVVQGLIGLAIAGAVGLIVVNLAPILSMKFANWKVKGIIAEARENPIETMVNLLSAKKAAFREFKAMVENAVVGEKTFESKCSQFARQYPARAAEFDQQLVAIKQAVERKKLALREAQTQLVEGENKLTEMRAYFEMAEALNAANKATGMDTGDIYERLKADTACDAVFESMNRAFANLEVESALNTPALENNPSPVLNVVSSGVTSKIVL
jgi:hypothetical protein